MPVLTNEVGMARKSKLRRLAAGYPTSDGRTSPRTPTTYGSSIDQGRAETPGLYERQRKANAKATAARRTARRSSNGA